MITRNLLILTLVLVSPFAFSQDRAQAGSDRMTLDNYAINTPSWRPMAEGLRSYRSGGYKRAFAKFRFASNWANKHAQAWVGWMYLLGQGVEKDVPRAYAWLKLAAERGYPSFVDDVEALSGAMDKVALAHGELILNQELLPNLGDEVAIRRTSREMWSEKMKVTGSRVGYSGRLQGVEHTELGRFQGEVFYAADRWDFERVVAFETRAHLAMARGTIRLRDLHLPGSVESTSEPAESDDE